MPLSLPPQKNIWQLCLSLTRSLKSAASLTTVKNELQAQGKEQIVQDQITLNLIRPTKSAYSLSHLEV